MFGIKGTFGGTRYASQMVARVVPNGLVQRIDGKEEGRKELD